MDEVGAEGILFVLPVRSMGTSVLGVGKSVALCCTDKSRGSNAAVLHLSSTSTLASHVWICH